MGVPSGKRWFLEQQSQVTLCQLKVRNCSSATSMWRQKSSSKCATSQHHATRYTAFIRVKRLSEGRQISKAISSTPPIAMTNTAGANTMGLTTTCAGFSSLWVWRKAASSKTHHALVVVVFNGNNKERHKNNNNKSINKNVAFAAVIVAFVALLLLLLLLQQQQQQQQQHH